MPELSLPVREFCAEVYREYAVCYYCNGSGEDPHGGEPECPICGGDGETWEWREGNEDAT